MGNEGYDVAVVSWLVGDRGGLEKGDDRGWRFGNRKWDFNGPGCVQRQQDAVFIAAEREVFFQACNLGFTLVCVDIHPNGGIIT